MEYEPDDKQAPPEYYIDETARPAKTTILSTRTGILIHFGLGLSLLWYIYCRVQACIQSHTSIFDTNLLLWLFFACEVIPTPADFHQYLEVTLAFFVRNEQEQVPLRRLSGSSAPSVHVFVTTCGEDESVIMDTVAAAAVQDYPRTSFRVFVLDDAKQEKIKLAVERFNVEHVKAGYLPVVYEARPKEAGVFHRYKAGNLLHGIELSREQYGSSEFIAGLDADQIPQAHWLQLTVPHMLFSPKLALVSPPQGSYDVPGDDALAQDHGAFPNIWEPLRSRRGCSQCNGSGYVIRRIALDSIGGWPQCNVGEDIVCSWRLLEEGWTTTFVPDTLQAGTSAGSFHLLLVQRMRWFTSDLTLARRYGHFLPFLNTTNMPWVRRVHGIIHSTKIYWSLLMLIPLLGGLLLPATSKLTPSTFDRKNFRTAYLLFYLTSRIWQHLVFSPIGTQNRRNLERYNLWVLPYQICSTLQSLAANVEDSQFVVSGSFKSPVDERARENRSPLAVRLCNPAILMHACYGALAMLSLAAWVGMVALLWGGKSYLHTGLTVRLSDFLVATMVPVRYMLFPPTALARRDRLVKDTNGVYRPPSSPWTRREGGVISWKDAFDLAVIVLVDWL